jgi:dTDP-4-dehydrorhamnose reductase
VKRILVTGASGLLGLNLITQAAGRYEVWGVLRQERPAPGARLPFFPLYADLTKPGHIARLIDQARPEAIFNCAAMTEVDYCETHPVESYLINAQVPENLALAAYHHNIPFLHVSTDAVFDGTRGDYTETDPPSPLNIYAKSKLAGERGVSSSNPDATIARVNFYGWSWQGRRSLAEFFYNNLAAGNAIRGFTDLVFCPLLVNDMAAILLRMVHLQLAGTYHVVSSESMSKFSFGRMLARQFGYDEKMISASSYKTANLRAPRSRLLTLRSEKLARALGETLPGQAEAMRRFHALHCQGYSNSLRGMFASSDRKPEE